MFDSPGPGQPNQYNQDSIIREEDLFQRSSRIRDDVGSRGSSYNYSWNPTAVRDYSSDVPAPPPSLRYSYYIDPTSFTT